MSKLSWRVKLIGLFVLILSASLLFQLLYIIPHVRDREVKTTQTEQQHVGRSIGRELDLGLQRIESELVRIAQQPEFRNMEIAKQGQVMSRIIGIFPDMSSLFAMDAEGWFVSSNIDDLSAYTTRSYADQGFFDIAFNKGKTYFGVPIFYPQVGFVGVSISVPITSDTGRRVGVLMGGLVFNDLMEFVANYPLAEGIVAFLVDREGTVVAHSGMNLFALKKGPLSLNYRDQPLVRAIREGKEEGSQKYDQEGTSYFGSYTTLKSNDWGVVVETPMHIILAESNELARELAMANIVIFLIALAILLVFTQQITSQRQQSEKKVIRLNTLLAAIRHVNQLIAREKDRDRLLQGICRSLVEARGYHKAWIALLDKSGQLITTAETGVGKNFSLLVERLESGRLIQCARKAISQSEIVIIKDPASTCIDCPLSATYAGRGTMTVRLEHAGKIYGVLSVCRPLRHAAEEEEQPLFKELAGDLASALYSLELAEERKRVEEELRESEERFRTLFYDAKDGMLLADNESRRIHLGNRMICQMLGYDEKEIKDIGTRDIHPKKDLAYAMEQFDKQLRGDTTLARNIPVKRKDGTVFYADISAAPITLGGRTYLMGLFRDITERREAEEKLQKTMSNLERFNRLAVGREQRMIELKGEVNNLLRSLGRPEKYKIPKSEKVENQKEG